VSLERVRLAVGVEPGPDGVATGFTDFGAVERGGLFGGQVVAQSLSASALTAPDGSVPVSIHAHFLGASQTGPAVEYHVERVRDGRALQHRDVRAFQEGRLIAQASVVSTIPADGADWQLPVMPRVGPPDVGPDAGRAMFNLFSWGAFEMVLPLPEGDAPPATHPFWVRAIEPVPEDAWLRGAVQAFWSDLGLNGDARTTHERVLGPTSSVSATHSLVLHRLTPPHEWHLFDVTTQSLAGNQGFVQSSLFHESGALVASAAQSVFIRRPQAP
jgi:acyl-CoA thioesterase II